MYIYISAPRKKNLHLKTLTVTSKWRYYRIRFKYTKTAVPLSNTGVSLSHKCWGFFWDADIYVIRERRKKQVNMLCLEIPVCVQHKLMYGVVLREDLTHHNVEILYLY